MDGNENGKILVCFVLIIMMEVALLQKTKSAGFSLSRNYRWYWHFYSKTLQLSLIGTGWEIPPWWLQRHKQLWNSWISVLQQADRKPSAALPPNKHSFSIIAKNTILHLSLWWEPTPVSITSGLLFYTAWKMCLIWRSKINLARISLREWLQIGMICNSKTENLWNEDMQPGGVGIWGPADMDLLFLLL